MTYMHSENEVLQSEQTHEQTDRQDWKKYPLVYAYGQNDLQYLADKKGQNVVHILVQLS